MSIQRIIGLVLLAAGVALLVLGINASHSFADRTSNYFTGHFTDRTTWYIVGGIASGVVGLVLVFLPGRKALP